jgi:hypothetical protein
MTMDQKAAVLMMLALVWVMFIRRDPAVERHLAALERNRKAAERDREDRRRSEDYSKLRKSADAQPSAEADFEFDIEYGIMEPPFTVTDDGRTGRPATKQERADAWRERMKPKPISLSDLIYRAAGDRDAHAAKLDEMAGLPGGVISWGADGWRPDGITKVDWPYKAISIPMNEEARLRQYLADKLKRDWIMPAEDVQPLLGLVDEAMNVGDPFNCDGRGEIDPKYPPGLEQKWSEPIGASAGGVERAALIIDPDAWGVFNVMPARALRQKEALEKAAAILALRPAQQPVEGEPVQAVKFATAMDDPFEAFEFLKAWLSGDLTEWPEYEEARTTTPAQQAAPTPYEVREAVEKEREACALIALALDSLRGNETMICDAIRNRAFAASAKDAE